jgi:RNA polymerase sigma factor (sigma-70 family)
MRNEELIVSHIEFARQLAAKKQRSLALHVEASDLESEAIFAMMKAGERFNPDSNVPFTAFVRVRIAGQMNDWCSYRNQQPFAELSDVFLDMSATRCAFHGELARRLKRFVGRLPARLRTIIRLRYVDGFTQSEIAPMLGVNESRIGQLERKALGKLKVGMNRRGVHKVADIL